MAILTLFKFKSSKSKAKKLSISAPVAVAAIPPTTEVVPRSSRSSMEEEIEPSQAVAADDSALTAPVQVIKGNQKYLGLVTNNNSVTANSNNTNIGNVNSTITGDSITIEQGINEVIRGPAKMLFTPEGATRPTRIRNSVTIERNGVLEATIPLDFPSSGLGIEGVVTSNPDLPTMIEQAMRAHGTAEPIIRHTVNGLRVALQMKAMQSQVPVTA